MANEGINFSLLVYDPCMDTFAVIVYFNPLTSMPGGAEYAGRGIFRTDALNVLAENNEIYSDQRTLLDIRHAEFPVLPQQGDHIRIPKDCNGEDKGEWVIVDSNDNGGGETEFTLRKWEG